ncbi:transforming growth factor beta regulator 1-like [Ciona intestinalis]
MESRRDDNDSNARYRARYKLLRKSAKQLVYENAAMCNEISRLEERTVSAKVQRKFLLKKLFQLEKPEQRGNGQKNQRRTNMVQGSSSYELYVVYCIIYKAGKEGD